jgi:ArsR family transcriptional regulator, arsenate/arsenite/antimonite-responsive transcriptional repressor
MKQILAIATALSDESRLRALLAIRRADSGGGGELCLCHLIGLLKLAPSTLSKHMAILRDAGLVETRREGKWIHYRLAGPDAPSEVQAALMWITQSLARDPKAAADAAALKTVCKQKPEELCACYRN